jgi:hypothetical protein
MAKEGSAEATIRDIKQQTLQQRRNSHPQTVMQAL